MGQPEMRLTKKKAQPQWGEWGVTKTKVALFCCSLSAGSSQVSSEQQRMGDCVPVFSPVPGSSVGNKSVQGIKTSNVKLARMTLTKKGSRVSAFWDSRDLNAHLFLVLLASLLVERAIAV